MDTILKWLKVTQNLIIVGLSVIAMIAVISAVYNFYKKPEIVNVKEYVPTTEIKEVVKIKKVEVPGPEKIVTVTKEVVIEKVQGLPEWLTKDSNQQIIATATLPPWKGNTDIVGTLNTKTGEGAIIAKQLPRSLFGFANDREVGIRYGYGYADSKFQDEGAVYGRWDFLRVGNAYLGVYAEGTTRGDAKAQLSLGYKF